MDMSLATSVLSMKQAATQQTAEMKILKKQHDMDMALIEMIDEVSRSAPQPGQGTVVDKLA